MKRTIPMTLAMGHFLGRVAVGLAWVSAVGTATAADSLAGNLAAEPPPSALRCLVGGDRAALKYPEGLAEQRVGATLRVRLTFKSSDSAPDAEFFFDSAGDPFRAVVLKHVNGYRLPCLRSGAPPVAAIQEFAFLPGDGRKVIWHPLRDEQSTGDEVAITCLTGGSRLPEYPRAGLFDKATKGNVIVRLVFNSAEEPPQVDIVFDGGSKRFAEAIRQYVSGYRLPCLTADKAPLKAQQLFRFAVDGDRPTLFKDSSLAAFVRAIDKPEAQHVRFDFTTMECPFEVRFQFRRPYLPNAVGEVEKSSPNRREFLEWLQGVDLAAPERIRREIIGESMTIVVPCMILDLL